MSGGCLPTITGISPQTGVEEEGEHLLWYLTCTHKLPAFSPRKQLIPKRPKKEGLLSSWEEVESAYLSCQDLP